MNNLQLQKRQPDGNNVEKKKEYKNEKLKVNSFALKKKVRVYVH